MTPPIIDLDILSEEEARAVARRIRALEHAWLKRDAGFATLGVAAYLDVMSSSSPEADYYARVDAWNRVLVAEFGWLLERVRIGLEAGLRCKARLDGRVAMPGFHIFHGSGITAIERDSQHFDLQYRAVRWPFAIDDREILSFTLTLELPVDGGGLDYWDFTEVDYRRLERLGRKMSMAQIGRTKPHIRHPYRLGRMAVQTKPVMHRIAAVRQVTPGDHRITLQGHTVREWADGTTILYW